MATVIETTSRIVPCSRCGGSGIFRWETRGPGGLPSIKEGACFRCHGTGVQKRALARRRIYFFQGSGADAALNSEYCDSEYLGGGRRPDGTPWVQLRKIEGDDFVTLEVTPEDLGGHPELWFRIWAPETAAVTRKFRVVAPAAPAPEGELVAPF